MLSKITHLPKNSKCCLVSVLYDCHMNWVPQLSDMLIYVHARVHRPREKVTNRSSSSSSGFCHNRDGNLPGRSSCQWSTLPCCQTHCQRSKGAHKYADTDAMLMLVFMLMLLNIMMLTLILVLMLTVMLVIVTDITGVMSNYFSCQCKLKSLDLWKAWPNHMWSCKLKS